MAFNRIQAVRRSIPRRGDMDDDRNATSSDLKKKAASALRHCGSFAMTNEKTVGGVNGSCIVNRNFEPQASGKDRTSGDGSSKKRLRATGDISEVQEEIYEEAGVVSSLGSYNLFIRCY